MTSDKPVVSIGDLVADIIVAVPSLPAEAGRHQVADDVRLEPGGGANFLIAGSRLGYPMAAIGVLGSDAWGHRVAEMVQAEGVDVSGITHDGTTTTVIVLVGQSGGHVFLGKYGHGSKIRFRQSAVDLVKNAGAIFSAGYTLCEARLVDLALEAMRLAKQNGIPVFFDPGPQMADVPAEVRHQLLPLLDTVLATGQELPLLSPGGTVADVMQAGPSTVVVKRGPGGCAVYQNGQTEPVVEAPGYPVPVVDTSAAGDSFDAAFMVGTLWGWPVAHCATLSNAMGAAKVQKLGGGRNVPTPAEIQAVIDQFNVALPPLPNLSKT